MRRKNTSDSYSQVECRCRAELFFLRAALGTVFELILETTMCHCMCTGRNIYDMAPTEAGRKADSSTSWMVMLHNAAAVSIKSMLSATAAKSSWCWFSSHLLWMKFENFIRASCDGFSNALLGCHSSLHRCPMSLGMTLLGKVEPVKITCSGKTSASRRERQLEDPVHMNKMLRKNIGWPSWLIMLWNSLFHVSISSTLSGSTRSPGFT